MGSPATESSISQIVEKLDSLPNSERDVAVNNSIALSDSPGSFGEGVLKLYNESSPSAREAIAEMFELVCNEPLDNWLDRIERICDGFSKQKELVREFDSLPEAIAGSRRRFSLRNAQALHLLTESSKTSNLLMRAQSAVSRPSVKSSPTPGMRKLQRKTPTRNRSTRFVSKPATLSMTRWMIPVRLHSVRISISSLRPAIALLPYIRVAPQSCSSVAM